MLNGAFELYFWNALPFNHCTYLHVHDYIHLNLVLFKFLCTFLSRCCCVTTLLCYTHVLGHWLFCSFDSALASTSRPLVCDRHLDRNWISVRSRDRSTFCISDRIWCAPGSASGTGVSLHQRQELEWHQALSLSLSLSFSVNQAGSPAGTQGCTWAQAWFSNVNHGLRPILRHRLRHRLRQRVTYGP